MNCLFDGGGLRTHVSMCIKGDGWNSGPGTSDCNPATQWEESRTGFWGERCGTLRGTNAEGVRLAYKCVSGWLNNWSTGVWISEGEPYFNSFIKRDLCLVSRHSSWCSFFRTESLWTECTSFFQTESLSLWLPLWGKWNSTRLISPWPWLECQNIIKEKVKRHGNMYQVHFSNSSWFLNELGPCLASATCGQAFLGFVYVFTKADLKVLEWQGDGNERCLS